MSRFLLDTSIISDATKPEPQPAIERWMASQPKTNLFISTVTLGEIWRGIARLPKGRRKTGLQSWLTGPQGPQALFEGNILAYSVEAAIEWARTMAAEEIQGRPRGSIDTMIAAIAIVNKCTVVTSNERHFDGIVPVFNPLAN